MYYMRLTRVRSIEMFQQSAAWMMFMFIEGVRTSLLLLSSQKNSCTLRVEFVARGGWHWVLHVSRFGPRTDIMTPIAAGRIWWLSKEGRWHIVLSLLTSTSRGSLVVQP